MVDFQAICGSRPITTLTIQTQIGEENRRLFETNFSIFIHDVSFFSKIFVVFWRQKKPTDSQLYDLTPCYL